MREEATTALYAMVVVLLFCSVGWDGMEGEGGRGVSEVQKPQSPITHKGVCLCVSCWLG